MITTKETLCLGILGGKESVLLSHHSPLIDLHLEVQSVCYQFRPHEGTSTPTARTRLLLHWSQETFTVHRSMAIPGTGHRAHTCVYSNCILYLLYMYRLTYT